MPQRMQDWAKLWQIRDTRDPVPLANAEQLLQDPKQRAASLPEISLGHLAHVLKHLPDRAAGRRPHPTCTHGTTSGTPTTPTDPLPADDAAARAIRAMETARKRARRKNYIHTYIRTYIHTYIGQLARTLKALPNKASGPDSISAQLLRTAPPLSLQPWLKLIHEMEQAAQLPTQLKMHMVAMLPKNQTIERPITLTSVLYRVWCRLRKPVLDDWQRNLPPHMNHGGRGQMCCR